MSEPGCLRMRKESSPYFFHSPQSNRRRFNEPRMMNVCNTEQGRFHFAPFGIELGFDDDRNRVQPMISPIDRIPYALNYIAHSRVSSNFGNHYSANES